MSSAVTGRMERPPGPLTGSAGSRHPRRPGRLVGQIRDEARVDARIAAELDRRVADRLGIPHYIVNFESHFHAQVVTNFIGEYSAGTGLDDRLIGELGGRIVAALTHRFGDLDLAEPYQARLRRTLGVDLALVNGYGFPNWRGGPAFAWQ